MMKKTIAAGTIALTLAGAGYALAQQQTLSPDMRGARPTAEDVTAMTDARIAALKAGLKLTPEQEKNWPAVETAIRDLAKTRADRFAEFHERREARRNGGDAQARPDFVDRLRRGADAMSTRAAGLKKFADAAEPLYKSLDEGQKRRFAMLVRMGAGQGGHHGHMHMHWPRRADAQ
jgi:zinc resistance-associated protein